MAAVKKFFHSLSFGAVIGLFLFLTSCQSTVMKSVDTEPDFANAKIHKILVVSISSTPEIRKLLEKEFALQLGKRGGYAVASFTVLSPESVLDKATIAPYAHRQGFDAVIVSRLISRKALDKNAQVRQIGKSGKNQTSTDDLGWTVASPDYPQDFEVAALKTTLYDVASERIMWSAVSQTLITSDVPKRIRPYVKVILKNLYQEIRS